MTGSRVASRPARAARLRDRHLVDERDAGASMPDLARRYGWTVRSASTIVTRARRRIRIEQNEP